MWRRFRVLGGVPTRHIRYDNLKPAVRQVLFGRGRVESQRWVAFRSHYGFHAFYCLPGKDGAHEKGGVEHEGGRFRRNHLVPPPQVASLAELNDRLAVIDAEENARHVHGAPASIEFNFAAEAPLLHRLPADDFELGTTLTPLVRRSARIVVRQCYCSVPARFIDRKVRVSLRANEVLVFDGRHVVARHPRLSRRYDYHDDLDHYLEILLVKPGALAGSTALAQARAEGSFTPAHDAFWAAARAAHGEAAGTRALIEVLLLHRQLPHPAIVTGITATVNAGSCSPELVAIEARKAADTGIGAPPTPEPADAGAEDGLDLAEPDEATSGARVISLSALPATALRHRTQTTAHERLRPTAVTPIERYNRVSSTVSTGKVSCTPRPRQSAPGVDPLDAAIDTACAELRLPTIRDRYAEIAEQALRDRANCKGFLLDLLRAEIADRDERRKQRLIREAAFHRPKLWSAIAAPSVGTPRRSSGS